MNLDPFYFWRWLLVVVCTIYWALCMGRSLWGWYEYLWSEGRSTELMRHYAFVKFLRIRVHRFTIELAQIMALLVMFTVITWAHRYAE
jgi:hypothetical protein